MNVSIHASEPEGDKPAKKRLRDAASPGAADEEHCSVQRPRRGLGSESTRLLQSPFLGKFIRTPQAVDARGELCPPQGWERKTRYEVEWVEDFEEPISTVED